MYSDACSRSGSHSPPGPGPKLSQSCCPATGGSSTLTFFLEGNKCLAWADYSEILSVMESEKKEEENMEDVKISITYKAFQLAHLQRVNLVVSHSHVLLSLCTAPHPAQLSYWFGLSVPSQEAVQWFAGMSSDNACQRLRSFSTLYVIPGDLLYLPAGAIMVEKTVNAALNLRVHTCALTAAG
jgi:hypothetical protein